MKKFFLFSILMPLCGFAQNLSTEVVVDRTVAVELPDASPVTGAGPKLSLPQRDDRALRVTDYTMPADFKPSLASANPAAYTGIATPPGYRGFAWLGYFPAYNLVGGVGYKVLDSASNSLVVAAAFDGASWHGYGSDGDKPTQRYNTVNVDADYSHVFSNKALLTAKAGYTHDALRLPYFSPVYDADAPQAFNHGDFEVSFSRGGDISYSARAYYRFFGVADDIPAGTPEGPVPGAVTLPGASDKIYGVDGYIGARLSESSSLRFDIAAGRQDSDGRHFVMLMPEAYDPGHWLIGLNPTFRFEKSNFRARLGIHADFCTDTPNSVFHISPDAGFDWQFAPVASLYVDIDGGQRFNTLSDLYDYSVFAPGFGVCDPMWIKIDATAGVRLGSFGGFSADIHGRYSSADNVPVASIVKWQSDRVSQTFREREVRGWSAGAKLTYSYSDLLTVNVSGDIYSHGREKGYWRLHDNAKATLDADISVNASPKLRLGADYRLRACRFAYYDSMAGSGRYNLGNVSLLGLNATYRFADNISFFGRVDNLLCHRHQILPGLRSQGLHGLVGVSYLF